MMKQENQQDHLLKSLFKEAEIHDKLAITELVMHDIQEVPIPKKIEYKAPISKTTWLIVGSVCVLMVMYSFLLENTIRLDVPSTSLNIQEYAHRITNSFKVSIPSLPSLSLPFLAAIFAFNVGGMYFILTYRRRQKT